MKRDAVKAETPRQGRARGAGRQARAWARRIAVLAVLVTATAVSLAGCGGGPASPAGASNGSASPAGASGGSSRLAQALAKALSFSRCMRAHGLTGYPDPREAGGQITMTVHVGPGSKLNSHSPWYQAAQNACRSFSPAGNLTTAQKAAANARALKYSRCMRSHGISSYPDPNGQGTLVVQAGGGIDPSSPQFQNAQKACQSLDSGFNMDTSNFPS